MRNQKSRWSWSPVIGSLGTTTTTIIFNQGSFALFSFALLFVRFSALFFIRLHLNKEFLDQRKKAENRGYQSSLAWSLLYEWEKWNSQGVNWLGSWSLVKPGCRPTAAWLSPLACDPRPRAFLRDFLSHRKAHWTSDPALGTDWPIPHSHASTRPLFLSVLWWEPRAWQTS